MSQQPDADVIEVTQVSKQFKGIPVLSDVSVRVARGSIVGIEGPNGSGKSVLLKMMCGFVRPDSGHVRVHPDFMDPGARFPSSFGVIIDRPGYIPARTGMDNLRALARIRDEIGDDEIRAAMGAVGLDPGIATKVRHYSLGMKQKLGIAQAVMENQQVLILDEPFNALDASSVDTVKQLLRSKHASGTTIVLTSHHAADINELCDEVFRLDAGRLLPRPS